MPSVVKVLRHLEVHLRVDIYRFELVEREERKRHGDFLLDLDQRDALARHRTFQIFLFGCSVHEGITLSMLEGLGEVREKIGAYVGVVVGVELRRLRGVVGLIAAVDWDAHDEDAHDEEWGGESGEEWWDEEEEEDDDEEESC